MAAMMDTQDSKQDMLESALRHLQSGLDLLDDASAPGDIGAHVDLAVRRLERAIAAAADGSARSQA